MTIEIKTAEKQVLFDHEKLTVYQVAIVFVILADNDLLQSVQVLDVSQLRLIEKNRYIKGRELLIGIVSMLIKMVQKHR